mmetsp:Transcript_17543/g.29601  ORF Transcript_17543/g.29601 Transcript_17543/m.29601 type:complete len:138 (-) Transcript_17543:860-1273(-)
MLTSFSAYQVTKLEIDFKNTYFVNSGTKAREYIDKQDEYFESGDAITFYTWNESVDYADQATQQALNSFNEALLSCEGCSQQWLIRSSFNSWWQEFKAYSKTHTARASSQCYQTWLPSEGVLVASKFYSCLGEYLDG